MLCSEQTVQMLSHCIHNVVDFR